MTTLYHNQSKRANGVGSITVDKSTGKYLARFTSPISGKRIAKRFTAKKDAETWLAEQVADAKQGTYIEPSKLTLGDWCCEYLETYSRPHVSPRTLQTYVDLSMHLEPLWPIPIQKLTATQVQKYFNSLDLGANTKNKACKLLKQIMKKAFALGMVPRDITGAVETPKYTPGKIETFTLDEIKRLLVSVRNSQYYSRYYPMIHLAAASGMRLGEILGLKIDSVFSDHICVCNNLQDLHHKSRQDMPTKTEAGNRDIALGVDIISELRRAYVNPVTSCPYVFHTGTGCPYNHQNIHRMWLAVLKEAGLPPRHFHALRHTHATELLAAGIPLLEVSHRLGHAKPSLTLDMYGHAIKDYDAKIAQLASNMF